MTQIIKKSGILNHVCGEYDDRGTWVLSNNIDDFTSVETNLESILQQLRTKRIVLTIEIEEDDKS